jgi:hypothetical protein
VGILNNGLPRCTICNPTRGGSRQACDSSQDIVHLVKDHAGLWVLGHTGFVASSERIENSTTFIYRYRQSRSGNISRANGRLRPAAGATRFTKNLEAHGLPNRCVQPLPPRVGLSKIWIRHTDTGPLERKGRHECDSR